MLRGINGRVLCGNISGECSGEAVVVAFLESQMPLECSASPTTRTENSCQVRSLKALL